MRPYRAFTFGAGLILALMTIVLVARSSLDLPSDATDQVVKPSALPPADGFTT